MKKILFAHPFAAGVNIETCIILAQNSPFGYSLKISLPLPGKS